MRRGASNLVLFGDFGFTWTPKVCRLMAFWAILRGFWAIILPTLGGLEFRVSGLGSRVGFRV